MMDIQQRQDRSLSSELLTLIRGSAGPAHNRVPSERKGLVVSAVGGGGKTTILYLLAEALAREGGRVCVTTTTHIYDPRTEPQPRPCNQVVIVPELAEAPDRNSLGAQKSQSGSVPQAGHIAVVAAREGIPDHSVHQPKGQTDLLKLGGIHPAWVERLSPYWDLVLVEADGSKHLPVKAPADHEPVVPEASSVVLGCIGLDCLGKPMDERYVHRPVLFRELTGCQPGEPIGSPHLINLVLHPQGLFKGAPSGARRVLVFNKVDVLADGALQDLADSIGLVMPGNTIGVVLGSARLNRVYDIF